MNTNTNSTGRGEKRSTPLIFSVPHYFLPLMAMMIMVVAEDRGKKVMPAMMTIMMKVLEEDGWIKLEQKTRITWLVVIMYVTAFLILRYFRF